MVQRKLANKLGFKTDDVNESEKVSSPSQNQDTKNEGVDLKKKMKKSRSIKNSDFKSLRSKDIPQPGKPPTSDHVKTRGATPQRQSLAKVPEVTTSDHVKTRATTPQRRSRVKATEAPTSDHVKTRAATPLRQSLAKAPEVPTSDHVKIRAATPQRQSPAKAPEPPTSDHIKTRAATPQRQSPMKAPEAPTSDHVKTRAATPQRQSPVKAPEASHNYMKSTSSFDARKERSQVSSKTPQNSLVMKNMSPQAVGTLSKTSNLKLMRTLTKTPSFKPTRASMRKYSPIALCEEFDVQKPTCSSTLKDSKFPTYLELSAGATEYEGTSAMKVCPYTYCSLNGHHHAPVPPLKSFLSAKRRMLKAQKIVKLGCLSPRRAKQSRKRMIETGAKDKILVEKPATEGMEVDGRPITPVMHEKQTDFFVEIYSNNMYDTEKEKSLESVLSTRPSSDIDFEKYLDQRRGEVPVILNDIKLLKRKDQACGEIQPLPITQEDVTIGCLSAQDNSYEESQPISQQAQSDSDASDMEWEAGHHYEPSLYEVPVLNLKVTDINNGPNHESISKSDNDLNNSNEDILSDEVRVEFYDEKSVSSGAWSDDGDSDLDVSYQNIVFSYSYLVCNEESKSKSDSTCDLLEDLTSTGEEDKNCESVETRINPTEEFMATSLDKSQVPEASNEILEMELNLGFDETECTNGVDKEALFDCQGNETAEEESQSWLLQNQDSNSFQDFMEQDQDQTHKDYSAAHYGMEFYECDSTSESRFRIEISYESLMIETKYKEAENGDHGEEIPTVDARDEMEEEELLAVKSFVGIQTFESLEDSEQETTTADAAHGEEGREQVLAATLFVGIQSSESLRESAEPIQDMIAAVNTDQSKQECETNQSYVDETLPYESTGVANHEFSEINEDQSETYKFTGFKYSEDQTHLGAAVLQSTPNQNQDFDSGEGESKNKLDAAEPSSIAKSSASTQKGDYIFSVSNSIDDTTQTAKSSSWTTGSRKTVEEIEEIRDFNPREPNYLPVEPDPEAEKVDLRHQTIDERKNAEEWMVDYALRQTVTKLAPARRRKVSLLVEAFEKVLPTPKYETHPRRTLPAFGQARTIQACR